jgi:methylglutaconyl-CoA hydratase
MRVRQLRESVVGRRIGSERRPEIWRDGDPPRLRVQLHRDAHAVARIHSGRGLDSAVDPDVPHSAVHAGRRAPRVTADRDLHRRTSTSEGLLQSERHAEHRRRLPDPFEIDGEALRGHGGTIRGESRGSDPIRLRTMSALEVARDGHVLRVTLARPERRNAFDAALIAELADAFADVGDARAVLLAGEGPAFCAGADVEWQRAAIDLSYDENVEDAMRLYGMLEAVDSCPAPVVCCVHGYALGGGSGLVACADIAIAQPDAVFGFTEVRLGIIPAVISPFVLPRIGTAARRYFVTGERFGADDARRIGLISEVSEDAAERAESVVRDIAAGGPIAVREAKKLVRERPLGEETAHIAAARRTSEEGQDGLRAFLERRAPGWIEGSA